ncbi:BamA/TamA family outer membrane protein [Shewanella sp. UCD-KL12]|uniref:BamA/TamA family outer membrane protein n=1 Tax=Shewanella sp. UCD-KL12 TaxID=1917163 RepID=UPI00097126A2|nr:BamA/TamA family outer membrane protein [Shewanella sp. UCD-KL12]
MNMKLICVSIVCLSSMVSFSVVSAPAANVKTSVNRVESPDRVKESLILPYLFSSESMGLNLGVGGMLNGYYQDQMTIGGTVFGGEVSKAGGGGVWNFKLPKTERFFLSVYGMMGYYPKQRAYAGGTLDFIPISMPLPGSNDSAQTQYLEADGSSNWFDIKLEYALPFGATANKGMVEYQLKNGLLISEPSGGDSWNPLTHGATVVVLRQFNRYQSFEFEEEELDGTIHAIELGILHDNTDFSINPSTGSSQYLSISHDAAWLDSDNEWTFINLDMSKYFSFGSSEYAHQRILALNFWTGYSPSWELEYDGIGGKKVIGNAPYNEAATLGGFYRMRGYDQNRFHDKASIYGSAEYRYTLKYNPIEDVNWLKFLKIDWFQLVGFVEAGRVGAEYTASELLTDLKYDAGFSIRAMAAGLVVRTDIAVSDEGTNTWVMVDHPF